MPDFSQSPLSYSPIRQFFQGLVSTTDTLFWYFGGLVLFFFGVMVVSGILLAFHYQPNAAQATTSDGTPLLLARITDTTTWLGTEYFPGDLVPVRADSTLLEADFPVPLRATATLLRDSATNRPVHPSAAWVSLEHQVMRQTEFGALIRSVHAWGAQLLVASLLIWFSGLVWQRAWRHPNSAVWISGLLLLVLVLGSAWTGSVLPWDRLGYAAAWVGSSLAEQGIPLIGESVTELMRGGKDVGDHTLTRISATHTVLLPIALVAMLILHGSWWRQALVVQKLEIASPKRLNSATVLVIGSLLVLLSYPFITSSFNPASPFFLLPLLLLPVCSAQLLNRFASGTATPAIGFDGLYRQLVCWMLVSGALLTLAIAASWSRGHGGFPIDLTQSQLAAGELHPEWYFLGFYQLLEWFSAPVAMAFTLALLLFFIMLPKLDRSVPVENGRIEVRWFVCFVLLLLLFLTLWGYMRTGE